MINEFPEILEFSELCLFSDAVLVYCIDEDIQGVLNKINQDVTKFSKELKSNKLKLNAAKTKSIAISKELGTIADNKLKFDRNTEYICKKKIANTI